MSGRGYRAFDVDRMRDALSRIGWARNRLHGTTTETVEILLRTHLADGTDPDDLVAFADKVVADEDAKDRARWNNRASPDPEQKRS